MKITIRTDTLRHALSDLRALDRAARDAGTRDDRGRHFPDDVRLDDGTLLVVFCRAADGGGVLPGVFDAVRYMNGTVMRRYAL